MKAGIGQSSYDNYTDTEKAHSGPVFPIAYNQMFSSGRLK